MSSEEREEVKKEVKSFEVEEKLETKGIEEVEKNKVKVMKEEVNDVDLNCIHLNNDELQVTRLDPSRL